MKNNNDIRSHQSIGLDDDEGPSERADGHGALQKRNRDVMGRIARTVDSRMGA